MSKQKLICADCGDGVLELMPRSRPCADCWNNQQRLNAQLGATVRREVPSAEYARRVAGVLYRLEALGMGWLAGLLDAIAQVLERQSPEKEAKEDA